MFQVSAQNQKGDFRIEVVQSKQAADVLHARLWNQIDSHGDLQWSTVKTARINEGERS
jgi:hypothetical protein